MRNLLRLALLVATLLPAAPVRGQGLPAPDLLTRLGAALAGTWEGETIAIQLTINPPARGAITALATSFQESMNGQFNGVGIVVIEREGGNIRFREKELASGLTPALNFFNEAAGGISPDYRLTRLSEEEAVFQCLIPGVPIKRYILQFIGHDELLVRIELAMEGKKWVTRWLFTRAATPAAAELIRKEHQADKTRQDAALKSDLSERQALIDEYQRRINGTNNIAMRLKLKLRLEDFQRRADEALAQQVAAPKD